MSDGLPPDTAGGFEVDLQVMRADAKLWESAAGRMASAKQTAQGLNLGVTEFSILAQRTGLREAYDDFQSWMVQLCGQAETEMRDLGNALTKAADSYEAKDRESANTLNQLGADG